MSKTNVRCSLSSSWPDPPLPDSFLSEAPLPRSSQASCSSPTVSLEKFVSWLITTFLS